MSGSQVDVLDKLATRDALIASNTDGLAVRLLSYCNLTFTPAFLLANIFHLRYCPPLRSSFFFLLSFLSFFTTSFICLLSTGTRSDVLFALVPVIFLLLTDRGVVSLKNIFLGFILPSVTFYVLIVFYNIVLSGYFVGRYGSIPLSEVIFRNSTEILSRIFEAPYLSAHIYEEYSQLIPVSIERFSYYIWLSFLKPFGLSGTENLAKDVGFWHQSQLDIMYAAFTHANTSFLFFNRFVFGGGFGVLISMFQLYVVRFPFALSLSNEASYLCIASVFGSLLNFGINSVIMPNLVINLLFSIVFFNLIFNGSFFRLSRLRVD